MKKDQINFGCHLTNGPQRAVSRRDGKEGTGTIMPVVDGRPIPDGAEIVEVENECHDGWHDMKTVYTHRATEGPPQVATPA